MISRLRYRRFEDRSKMKIWIKKETKVQVQVNSQGSVGLSVRQRKVIG